jgi:anti-sigma-K factor RskA
MSNDQHVIELLPAYALGALDRNEARLVEAHLAHCAGCQAELGQIEAITNDLPLALAEASPPDSLRHQLMTRIEPREKAVEAPPPPSFWEEITAVFRRHKAIAYTQAALIALVLLLLASTLLRWQQVNELSSAPEPGRLQAIRLSSTGIMAAAEGVLTVSGDGLSGAIILDQVPQLAEDQRYQLWLVKDGQRTSAALLEVDELGYGGGRVRAPESLFNYSLAEVTIEPAAGSEQPTTAVILRAPLFP